MVVDLSLCEQGLAMARLNPIRECLEPKCQHSMPDRTLKILHRDLKGVNLANSLQRRENRIAKHAISVTTGESKLNLINEKLIII